MALSFDHLVAKSSWSETEQIRVTATAAELHEMMTENHQKLTSNGVGRGKRYWFYAEGHGPRMMTKFGAADLLREMIEKRYPTINLTSGADKQRIWVSVADALIAKNARPCRSESVIEWVSDHLEDSGCGEDFIVRREILDRLIVDLPGGLSGRARQLKQALKELDLWCHNHRECDDPAKWIDGVYTPVVYGVRWVSEKPSELSEVAAEPALEQIPLNLI